ncbi:MAG: response regulator [Elusimicrobia bacterium]|nr:response regulator [Elusimicrobiota bacterium]
MIKIVIIEDDSLIRNSLRTFFMEKEYEIYSADNGMRGLDIVKEIVPHVVFLDIGLPDISGLDVLAQIKSFDKTIRVIMVSAMSGEDTIKEALRRGASDYITKPFTMEYLENSILKKVSAQVIEHQRTTIVQVVYALANTLDAKSKYTKGHSESVARYAEMIANEIKGILGWEWVEGKIGFIKNVALLHDIGKIGIEDRILNKPGELDEEESELMKKHPAVGANIVSTVDDLSHFARGIQYHHENWDGTGYDGLAGKDIPSEARILAVADAFDAMTSDRPYRKALTREEALEKIVRARGIQFDPEIVDALVRAIKKPMQGSRGQKSNEIPVKRSL